MLPVTDPIDSLRLTEHLAVELCAYLFQRFGSNADRLRDWLLDFGDQVARTQQHAHPAGPTAIEILSAVADDFTPPPGRDRRGGRAGTAHPPRRALPGILRPDHEAEDAREITLTLWAGPQLAALLDHDYKQINAYTSARN
ncbi:hypothetical protein ABZX74_47255 [Streptomyces olivaceoviridis]|uniref:hypothetical protein n=1 Tax=Streptomyces olivaceoviridis TaxID=1921 RepID=UPI0033B211C1